MSRFLDVDVVALFAKDKRPVPLRFRYEDEKGEVAVVKVGRVISVEGDLSDRRDPMFIYRCESVVDGVLREYELGYRVTRNEWYLKS